MDDTEFACLKAIVFFDPNARALTDPGVNVIRRFSLVADTEAIRYPGRCFQAGIRMVCEAMALFYNTLFPL